MKKVILNNCLRAVKLLLCLFVLVAFGCSSLKNANDGTHANPKSMLQVIVTEEDVPIFIQTIRELGITPRNVKQIAKETEKEFCFLFQSYSIIDFLKYRSEILSTGLVKQIN